MGAVVSTVRVATARGEERERTAEGLSDGCCGEYC